MSALEVSFEDSKLARTCRSKPEMLKKFGDRRAGKLLQRLTALRAAETLEDMRSLPGRCHELKGDLVGCLALDLDHPYRLLIRPAEETVNRPGGGLDWSTVRSVIVVDIVDYH